MVEKKQYNGLDVVKVLLAVAVAARHMIQIFYPVESKWRLLIGAWLSNLAVPVFFIIAGFFLFRKVEENDKEGGKKAVLSYCGRILRLYFLWSVFYLPIDYLNWYHGQDKNIGTAVIYYIQSFLFSSTTVQLWYLPALMTACFMVWLGYRKGLKVWQLTMIGGGLFFVGCIGDNWYFNQQLPKGVYQFLMGYVRYFMTMRNGVFYGCFFVALGFWFARTKKQFPFLPIVIGFVMSMGLMLYEVIHCNSTNMVFSSAPAAFFLFAAASQVQIKNRKLYPRLRRMSEWIYLSHVYFFHLYVWTARWNPFPPTKKGITISILVPMMLFSWCMAYLSECQHFQWVKKLI